MKKARKKARKYEICCDNFSNYTEKEYIDAYLGPIIYGAPVVENDSTPDREYQDTAEAEGYSINFCPFCGKIIKVMVLSCNCSLCTGLLYRGWIFLDRKVFDGVDLRLNKKQNDLTPQQEWEKNMGYIQEESPEWAVGLNEKLQQIIDLLQPQNLQWEKGDSHHYIDSEAIEKFIRARQKASPDPPTEKGEGENTPTRECWNCRYYAEPSYNNGGIGGECHLHSPLPPGETEYEYGKGEPRKEFQDSSDTCDEWKERES